MKTTKKIRIEMADGRQFAGTPVEIVREMGRTAFGSTARTVREYVSFVADATEKATGVRLFTGHEEALADAQTDSTANDDDVARALVDALVRNDLAKPIPNDDAYLGMDRPEDVDRSFEADQFTDGVRDLAHTIASILLSHKVSIQVDPGIQRQAEVTFAAATNPKFEVIDDFVADVEAVMRIVDAARALGLDDGIAPAIQTVCDAAIARCRMESKRFMTRSDVASLFGVSRQRVKQLVDAGVLKENCLAPAQQVSSASVRKAWNKRGRQEGGGA